jgi:hypothetical protein
VAPTLTGPQIIEVLRLIEGSDSVELKLTVPDTDHASAVAALDMDVLQAQIRQVVFLDTPDLALNQAGLVLRLRRVQAKQGDAIVKLRPIDPADVAPKVRASPSFGVEVDAMPGGFVCSGTMGQDLDDDRVKRCMTGLRPASKAFSKEQRKFFAAHAPEGIAIDDLTRLGPVNVLKLKLSPPELGRRLVAELWFYPDGTRLLELSTKCAPEEAFEVAAQTKAFLSERGIKLTGRQATKTKTALGYFSGQAARALAAAAGS